MDPDSRPNFPIKRLTEIESLLALVVQRNRETKNYLNGVKQDPDLSISALNVCTV